MLLGDFLHFTDVADEDEDTAVLVFHDLGVLGLRAVDGFTHPDGKDHLFVLHIGDAGSGGHLLELQGLAAIVLLDEGLERDRLRDGCDDAARLRVVAAVVSGELFGSECCMFVHDAEI